MHAHDDIVSYCEELLVYRGKMIFHNTPWGMWHNDDRKSRGCSLLVKFIKFS